MTEPFAGPLANANVSSDESTSEAVTVPPIAASSSPVTARSSATGASLTALTVTLTVAVSNSSPSENSTVNESVPLNSASPV